MPIFARRSDAIRLPRPRPWVMRALALLLTACAAAAPAPPPSQTDLGAKTVIFVASNGWHSGIVVAKADLPPDRLPETVDFPEARFLEFGWGDAVYYPAKQPTFGMAYRRSRQSLRAIVFPSWASFDGLARQVFGLAIKQHLDGKRDLVSRSLRPAGIALLERPSPRFSRVFSRHLCSPFFFKKRKIRTRVPTQTPGGDGTQTRPYPLPPTQKGGTPLSPWASRAPGFLSRFRQCPLYPQKRTFGAYPRNVR